MLKELRLTTTPPYGMFSASSGEHLVIPEDIGDVIQAELISDRAYIHGFAQDIAGFDIPTILDGDMNNLNLPVEEQNITLMLPDGNYKCKCEISTEGILNQGYYLITLFAEPSVNDKTIMKYAEEEDYCDARDKYIEESKLKQDP